MAAAELYRVEMDRALRRPGMIYPGAPPGAASPGEAWAALHPADHSPGIKSFTALASAIEADKESRRIPELVELMQDFEQETPARAKFWLAQPEEKAKAQSPEVLDIQRQWQLIQAQMQPYTGPGYLALNPYATYTNTATTTKWPFP